MRKLYTAICCLSMSVVFFAAAEAQEGKKKNEIAAPKNYRPAVFKDSPELQSLLSKSLEDAQTTFAKANFKKEEFAATLIDLQNPDNLAWASVRGEEKIYPASVVKMFYLAALERELEEGKVQSSPELERGIRDMIVVSSNEATQYILDTITDTSSGAEMPAGEFSKWSFKRNRVNRFFLSLGYQNINVNQKTFCEDAYGREQQFRNYKGENRNMLTTNATGRLLAEIVSGRLASLETTAKMLALLKRDPFAETADPDDQGHGFTGKMLADRKLTGAKLWSKAGWTSRARHDAAYVETADGLKFVLVIFTENHANEKEFIPAVAGKIIDGLTALKTKN